MVARDAYARVTPYELAFPDRALAEERFSRVVDEAEEASGDEPLHDPGRFLRLVSVSRTLAELRPADEGSERAHRHGVLLYHAFHFWRAGEPLYLLTVHAARYLVESGPARAPAVRPPGPAGYLQLPRYLFWSRPTDEESPEPVDGFFWAAPGDGRLSVLLACGIRGDRPGLSVVPLPTLPLADGPEWLESPARPEGEDFSSTLPGGEMDRLYSLETAGEVLKLVARFFLHLESVPGAAVEEEPLEAAEEGPRPTGLPYRRVGLEPGDPAAGPAGRDAGRSDRVGGDEDG